MTLPELAALAAKVPGFERPWGGVGAYAQPDDSPAALWMAVALYARKHHGDVEMNGPSVVVHAMQVGPGLKPVMRSGRSSIAEESEEAIARAALVALLRAHGVEVADG